MPSPALSSPSTGGCTDRRRRGPSWAGCRRCSRARNDKIAAGAPGRISASQGVKLLEVPTTFDRSKGDVHSLGNPHFLLDPLNVKLIVAQITDHFSQVDPKSAELYKANRKKFEDALDAKFAGMAEEARSLSRREDGYVPQGFVYLAQRFNLNVVDNLEPKPGIALSPAHIAKVIGTDEGQQRQGDSDTAFPESENGGDGRSANGRHRARYAATARRRQRHHHVLPADGSHRPNARQRFSAEELTVDVAVVWQVMKWPWPRALILPPLLVYLGLHVVEREVIFVDLALAQVATLGTCVALIMGYDFNDRMAFWISLGVTFLGAALFSWSRRSEKRPVPQEAIIGITFVVAAADSAAEPGHRRQRVSSTC